MVIIVLVELLYLDLLKLFDFFGYIVVVVEVKIVCKLGGCVSVQCMVQQQLLKEFIGGSNCFVEWVKCQCQMFQVIFIEGGYVNFVQFVGKFFVSVLEQVELGVFVVCLFIVVSQGVIFDIDKQVKELCLFQECGVFLVNDGMLFVCDSKVIGWSELKKELVWFKMFNEFCLFLIFWGGVEVYLSNSIFISFGYNVFKVYGIFILQYSLGMDKQMKCLCFKGWVIDLIIVDSWYGFYCYEVDDLVVKGNIYCDNIVYGIDLYDCLYCLIIVDNIVYGIRKKYGIIVLWEVNDSFIFNNCSYENKFFGIVFDCNSEGNLVVYNEVYCNYFDGIIFYESGDNLFWGNQVLVNCCYGICVCNSVNICFYENFVVGNQLIGVYGYIKDFINIDCNIVFDLFDIKVLLIVVGGKFVGNGFGLFLVDLLLSFELYWVVMFVLIKFFGISLFGVFGEKQDQIFDLLVCQDKVVLIDFVESQVEFQD